MIFEAFLETLEPVAGVDLWPWVEWATKITPYLPGEVQVESRALG